MRPTRGRRNRSACSHPRPPPAARRAASRAQPHDSVMPALAVAVVVHDQRATAVAGPGRLGLQPHRRPDRAQADPVGQDLRAPQPGLERRAVAHNPFGDGRVRLEVPVPGPLGAAEDDGVAVREQVGQLGRGVAGRDGEFGEARVGGHHRLAPDRGDLRVAGELAGVGPGAVHDGPGPGLTGRAGQGGHAGHGDPAARVLEPGPQVAEIGRHVNQRRGVTPAAAEPGRQLVWLARSVAAEFGEPVRRGGGAAEDMDPARDPHAGRVAAGPAASSRSAARVAPRHRVGRSPVSARCGPQIAPATAEVVSGGSRSARISTDRPASARQTAVVRPDTPAPTTSTSGLVPGTPVTS